MEKETSHTYTVSYTVALVQLARLAFELGASAFAPEVLARVPGAVRSAIADPVAIEQPERLLVITGEGPAAVTAREGALKVREACRLPAEGYDVEYLLHGHAVPLNASDHLLTLVPPDTQGLTAGVETAARAAGIGVTRTEDISDLPVLLAQIPLTVRLQALALRYALERGQNPDVAIEGPWDDAALWGIGVAVDLTRASARGLGERPHRAGVAGLGEQRGDAGLAPRVQPVAHLLDRSDQA